MVVFNAGTKMEPQHSLSIRGFHFCDKAEYGQNNGFAKPSNSRIWSFLSNSQGFKQRIFVVHSPCFYNVLKIHNCPQIYNICPALFTTVNHLPVEGLKRMEIRANLTAPGTIFRPRPFVIGTVYVGNDAVRIDNHAHNFPGIVVLKHP